ncbi:ATP-binding cassette domain-containing protein, partial [Breznakiellaceae bacterium SP9]
MSLLAVNSVSFSYNARDTVLDRISFQVECGEHIALVGPNGSGKSTLFQLLCGHYHPSEGEVLLDGRKIQRYAIPERARRIAFVPQGGRIAFPYTCLETVLMGLHPHSSRMARIDNAAINQAAHVMQQTGVWDLAEKPVTTLSGGQMQRILLARAILQIAPGVRADSLPKLLLLDETLSELDIAARIAMMKLLCHHTLDTGQRLTVIGIHHDLNLAYRFAGRIIAINNGKVFADGPPDSVFTPAFFAEVFAVRSEVIAGKGVTIMQTSTLGIGGMTCAACAGRIERTVKKLEGVSAATVN